MPPSIPDPDDRNFPRIPLRVEALHETTPSGGVGLEMSNLYEIAQGDMGKVRAGMADLEIRLG